MLLCAFVRISSTQPFLDDDVDENDLARIDSSLLNNYVAAPGRFASNYPRGFNYPESVVDSHQWSSLHPNNLNRVHLAKRIIMLPRVGRRSLSFD